MYEPQQYTLLLPAEHCASLVVRPQPKSAPEETAVKDALEGSEKRGTVATTVREVAAGMELGLKRAGGLMWRVTAEGEESRGAVALKCWNERGHGAVELGHAEIFAGSKSAMCVENVMG